MEKPLIKLYLIIAAALALTVAFLPAILGRTSVWAMETATRVDLLAYQTGAGNGPAPPAKDKGKVVFVMDDGRENQYTQGYAILKPYGFKACIAVIPAAVGTPGYMTYAQLAALYKDGWDMLNHTFDHDTLPDLTQAQQAAQITTARDWLAGHGLSRGSDILVYPQGSFTEELKLILKDKGFAAARSLKSLWLARTDSTLEDVDVCNLASDTPVEKAKTFIDKAMHNQSTVILTLNEIGPVTDDTKMQYDESGFQSLVAYIAQNKDRLEVVTLSELLAVQ